MRFLISAGEASGELYGAGLIEALRARIPGAEFFGIGGEHMRNAGCETVIDAHQISVVGLAEVVGHLPKIYREFKRLVREAERRKPDAAVLIDFPDFNLRLARELHRLGIPVIYYVSPQLWAWRQGRIAQIKRHVRKMLVIFPFEEAFYREHGVDVEYVGHPLADLVLPSTSREEFAAQYQLDPAKTWIALLPGSRRKEVLMNLPAMLEAAGKLQSPELQFVLPVANSLSSEWIDSLVGGVSIVLTHDARTTLHHARAAVVASGTATLETALIGTPFVMVYRVSPLTWALGRRLVKVERFAMPNLIAGRDVVTELVQSRLTAENVVGELSRILPDGPDREAMRSALAEVRAKLHSSGNSSRQTASERAAEAILKAIKP